MDIREIEEKGVMDNWLELKGFIREFLDQNYPLSQEDMRSILQGTPTDNAAKRQEVYEILNGAMDEVLRNAADRNTQIIDGANQGSYTQYTTEDVKRDIFEQKQQMLEILWQAQHPEEQLQSGQSVVTSGQNEYAQDFYETTEPVEDAESVQQGQQLIDDVVEESQDMDIRADEISNSNREINQAEIDYVQMQQQPQQGLDDGGMSIGE